MKIVMLTHAQYRNYANIHKEKNFAQTIEFSMLQENYDDEKMFLGLVDDNNNLYAATLLLVKNLSPRIKEAYAPNGFLINYSDFDLVRKFTEELIAFLKRHKVTYLTCDPMFKLRIYGKNNNLIENNQNILDNLVRLDYQPIGFANDFSKYDIVINNYEDINDIYRRFNRNTKRNIKESMNIGVSLHKGNASDIGAFYDIIKKKTKNNLDYYQNLMNVFSSKENKMEIFFAKLDPQKFLTNVKKMYEKESTKNEAIHNSIQIRNGKMTEKELNKKINSDSLLEKYKALLNEAILFSNKYDKSIVVGTCAVMRNNKEIYFLIDGYNEEFRYIHSSHMLKWALIKKYSLMGYNNFNLGEIHREYADKNNKYHGQYMYKIGFGGNIVEYPQKLLLVINKPMYAAYINFNKLKQKKKS